MLLSWLHCMILLTCALLLTGSYEMAWHAAFASHGICGFVYTPPQATAWSVTPVVCARGVACMLCTPAQDIACSMRSGWCAPIVAALHVLLLTCAILLTGSYEMVWYAVCWPGHRLCRHVHMQACVLSLQTCTTSTVFHASFTPWIHTLPVI